MRVTELTLVSSSSHQRFEEPRCKDRGLHPKDRPVDLRWKAQKKGSAIVVESEQRKERTFPVDEDRLQAKRLDLGLVPSRHDSENKDNMMVRQLS